MDLDKVIQEIKSDNDFKKLMKHSSNFMQEKSRILHNKRLLYIKRYRNNASGKMNKCWCYSGLDKKDCHFRKFKVTNPDVKLKSDIKRSLDNVEVCLKPDDTPCDNIINAHSIQKSGILKFLSDESGHVYRVNSFGDIEREGRTSKASTFHGMCKHHDDIFQIFENNEFNKFMGTEKEVFMTHYRAVVFELYRKLCVYEMLSKNIFLESNDVTQEFRVDEKVKHSNDKILNRIETIEFYNDYLYLRDLYRKEDWGGVSYIIFYIEGEPLVGATGAFIPYYSPDSKLQIQKAKPENMDKIAITTHHSDKGFIVVLSSFKSNISSRIFFKLLLKDYKNLDKTLFKVILEEMENVYLPINWIKNLKEDEMQYIKSLSSTFSNYTRTGLIKDLSSFNWNIFDIKVSL